jgi:hypothetical protein
VATPLWLAVHAGYVAVTVLHRAVEGPDAAGSPLLDWLRWDAWRYLLIADQGYAAVPEQAAFFPVYPLLYAALDPLLPGDLVVSAMVVSNLAGLGAMVVLHRLVCAETDEAVAGRTVLYLLAFPSAFFLAAPFNHSLFLLLALGFLYALRQRRWWVAGLLGALASGTRPVGVVLVAPFLYEYLRIHLVAARVRRLRFDVAAVALVPAGAVAYVAYCAVVLGDPLAYMHAQAATWDKITTWPGDTLWLATHAMITDPSYPLALDLTTTLAAIAAVALCLAGPWRLREDQWYLAVYAGAVLALPLCVPAPEAPVQSMTRYVLDAAVLFVVLGRAGGSRTFERLYLLAALAVQYGLLFAYLRGDWTF